jgi:hypothetical protein
LLFGPGGDLYVAGHWSGNVVRYDSTGAFKDVFVSGVSVPGPTYMTFTLTDPVTLAYVPEASTWMLFGLGLAVLVVARGRRRKVGRGAG